ncbi:MAG: DUF1801 domain-containing protein [Saprospiraceae bacterium]|nr:DUF1801 domain-containing protein [Saprospiraceae bacterium]
MQKIKAKTIDEYILNAPFHAQEKLMQIRKILKEIAPNAKEAIKWGQPVLEGKKFFILFQHINPISILCQQDLHWIHLERN